MISARIAFDATTEDGFIFNLSGPSDADIVAAIGTIPGARFDGTDWLLPSGSAATLWRLGVAMDRDLVRSPLY